MLGKPIFPPPADLYCAAWSCLLATSTTYTGSSTTRYVTSLFVVFLLLSRLSQPILILVSSFDFGHHLAYPFVIPCLRPLLCCLRFTYGPTHSKMFIGGLNWDTTDEGLRNYFSEFGKVDACTIMRDPSGTSRGFAFMTFEDPASVATVLGREHVLDGKPIDPKRAIPREEHLRNTRYFVGGLSPATTSESMKEFFSAYGKVVDATVMVDRESSRSKGFGFVTFEDATNADQLVGKLGLTIDDKEVLVLLFISSITPLTHAVPRLK
ncbi:hypothetical protein B0H17DRAFT_947405 [Mycena rosella]|uniref:RRM domain-containing protein n=1 Tax=Mycena rosella TaxID=1033263 RepID=A0AAD7GB31_MYCRO|nr:hypothetical protein B0H17DRAFT_947405 [Mycena rosella]